MSRDHSQEPRKRKRSTSSSAASGPSSLEQHQALGAYQDLQDDADGNDAETYAFRLFAGPIPSKTGGLVETNAGNAARDIEKTSQTTQRIRLVSPALSAANANTSGTAVGLTKRPISHYIAQPATEAQRAQYAASAVTGELVLERASRPCPGMRMPWRVIAASALGPPGTSQGALDANEAKPEAEVQRRRTRAGKKARLKLRQREQAARSRAETKKAAEKAREEADKAKEERIRLRNKARNRDKQLKRRQKAREARAAVAMNEADGDSGKGDTGGEEAVATGSP